MRLIQWWMAARKEPWEFFLKINNDCHIMSHSLKTQQNLWHILKTPQRSMQLCEVGCIRQVIAEELEKSSCDICICAAFSTPTPNYIYNHDRIFIAAKLPFLFHYSKQSYHNQFLKRKKKWVLFLQQTSDIVIHQRPKTYKWSINLFSVPWKTSRRSFVAECQTIHVSGDGDYYVCYFDDH